MNQQDTSARLGTPMRLTRRAKVWWIYCFARDTMGYRFPRIQAAWLLFTFFCKHGLPKV